MNNKFIYSQGQISLKNLIIFISSTIKKRIKIFIFLLLFNSIGIFFGAPKYAAEVSFYTDYRERGSSSGGLSFFDEILSNQNQLGFSVDNFIKSDRFLDEIVTTKFKINNKEASLAEHWYGEEDSYYNPITYIKKLDNFLHLKPGISKDELIIYKSKEKLNKKLKFKEDRKTGLHTLTIVIKKHSSLAVDLLQKSYDSIVLYSNQVTSVKALEKKSFIEGRLVEVKSTLENKEQELVNFINNNKNLLQSATLSLKKERIEREIALHSQLYIRLSDELEVAKLDEKDNRSSVFLLQTPKVSDVKAGGNKIINLLETAITILFLLIIIEVFLQRKKVFDFN